YRAAGWKIWTVGDDICWMRPGADGRLYAINPEAGFFGVAPGTSAKTNPNALAMLHKDAIFTNVAETADQQPWWEGLPEGVPVIDWQGRAYDPANGPAAHPNSRFTVSAKQCPSYTDKSEDPQGVPLSAIVFGGRRESLVPLVFEARDWNHGVLVGASMASETTAAATGAVGVVRRDSMAMKPFTGYNFGDYFAHWLSFNKPGSQLPKIFHVNWFRKNAQGKFMWPGFGDNMRVLEWILKRVSGEVEGQSSAIGVLPGVNELNCDGLDLSAEAMAELMAIDVAGWKQEVLAIEQYLKTFGDRTPSVLYQELAKTDSQLA
ncbi:MAG: phosphoenolpyruvate carboxykinase (GTP), partial [Arenimonas sp.]|nr:phosphoenolpyruvate carboxykinase (GTP) [Arenimonas sp.]